MSDAPTVSPSPAEAIPAPVPGAGTWRLHIDEGLQVHVPDRLSSAATYVLLEQEGLPEPATAFALRLLGDAPRVLDAGPGQGLFALMLAGQRQRAEVIAFQPLEGPRSRLLQSILDNRLADRLAVAPLGLAERAHEREVDGQADREALDAGAAPAPQPPGATNVERIRFDTLDAFLQRHGHGRRFDLVRLGAAASARSALDGGAGFFTQQSPAVMVEPSGAEAEDTDLARRFAELGYRLFRHLPGLDLLVPWKPSDTPNEGVSVRLFALKPERVAALAAQGLLALDPTPPPSAGRGALGPDEQDAAVQWLDSRAFAVGPAEPADSGGAASATPATLADPHAETAVLLLASVHADAALTPQARLDRCRQALGVVDALGGLGARPGGAEIARLACAVHALHLLGQRRAAVTLALQILQRWPFRVTVQGRFLPPTVSDLDRPRSSPPSEWLRLVLAEFVERQRATSSFHAPADPTQLRRLLRHPDHSAEIERRYALGEFRQNRMPDAGLLPRLRSGHGTRNPQLWRAVLDTVH